MATAAYAVLDPETGVLQMANAGHLPALIVGPEGGRILELAPSPPLGAFPYAMWTDHETRLSGEEMLVLYTDGLVERPGTPLMASIERLRAVTGSALTADEVCQLAVEQMIPFARLRDDVAIVALRYGSVPDELSMRLAAEPAVLADMRRVLRRWLRVQAVAEQEGREIVLSVSEVCANAIEHAYPPAPAHFQLTARRVDARLEFVVRDEGQWREPRGKHRGRGLKVARAAMDEVDVNSSASGTEVVLRKKVDE
jgi:anti-sigma regulatory factor (Ser/Thr protein kinase)